ncbi:hypothetical protein P8452_65823 [Trifolium repens]|nr:hypothetical protein P8452_65823 [Trifolium repens]
MDAENNTENNVKRRSRKKSTMTASEAKQHKEELEKLQHKDQDFYEFLKENDPELLKFSDDDNVDLYVDADMEDEDLQVDKEAIEHEVQEKDKKSFKKVITTSMVDLWCKSIKENGSLNAVRSLMRAFRTACHYGDDEENDSMAKLSVMSSIVFNKIMLTVLNEMDGILRNLLKLPASGGRKEDIIGLVTTKQWRSYGHIVKSYLGNALHILNQMTDTQMISFTLHQLKYSSLLLAAFPSLLRKYIKVALHFWGTGGGALPVVSSYVLNCHFLAMILRDALDTKTKEAFRKPVLFPLLVSMLLLDMLEMKELNRPPTGGVGKAVDLHSILKVSKPTLKTRAFQEACVFSVVEELAEHLALWSYSVAFMELSFIPIVRLRSFFKLTKVERFRREMRQLIREIEANVQFVNEKRMSVSFLPNDPAASSFLEDEKKSASSALSKYVITLRQRAQQKNNSLMESSVLVGEESSVFGDEASETHHGYLEMTR